MSEDILKPINNIKTLINENDQVLWECEASAKCYNQTSEKLKEECQRLHKEIAIIEEDICELQPQIEILSTCYDVQVECLALNQESLVNERLYKKRVNENIKKHQEEVNRTIEEYSQHFEKCKEKLEITNPAYKSLQTKRTELRKCKIRFLDMSKKLINLKNINQQKVDIRKKLFNGDIVTFAQSWLKLKRYFEATNRLNKEKQKEREYMKKLVEITEQLKQKQKEGYYRKETSFKIPQIEFSRNDIFNDVSKGISEKAKRSLDDPFSDLKKLLEKGDLPVVDKANTNKPIPENQNTLQRLEFIASNSKIRILENRTLNQSESGKPNVAQSKEERSRAISEKLQKVVQNFNKSISRHNSKKQTNAAPCEIKQVRNETQDILNKRCSQRTNPSQERNSAKMDGHQNVQHNNGSGTTQDLLNLSITNQNINSVVQLSQDSNKSSSQLSNKGYTNLIRQRDSTKTDASNFFTKPSNNTFSQENNGLPIVSEGTDANTLNSHMNSFSFTENLKPLTAKVPMKTNVSQPTEKSQFFLSSGFRSAFKTSSKNVATGSSNGQINGVFKKPDNMGLEIPKMIVQNESEPMETMSLSENTLSKRTEYDTSAQNTPFSLEQPGNDFIKNLNREMNNEGKDKTEYSSTNHGNFMKMGGMLYNFGNQPPFSQNLNESYDYDYGGGYVSPQFINMSPPSEKTNIPMDFGNQSSIPNTLFSFGNSSKPFNFK